MTKFWLTRYDYFWISYLEPLLRKSSIFRNAVAYASFFRRRNKILPVSEKMLSNAEWFKDFDIPRTWFTEKKKIGISGIARLKNSADFLEVVVESFLPYLDEIVLAAEQWTDGTNEICERLAKKYPDKVKYYFFPHKVNFRDYEWKTPPTTESIHSFAYFTNWAFSKSTYQYVMRLDDDILPVPETWNAMRKYILESRPNMYLLYYGINVLRHGNRVWVMKSLPRCGTWWDNGIYPVSEFSYFTQIPWAMEAFHMPLLYIPFEFWYIHLKNLKKGYGTVDYGSTEWWNFYKNFVENSDFWEIHEYTDFPASKVYEILVNSKIIP